MTPASPFLVRSPDARDKLIEITASITVLAHSIWAIALRLENLLTSPARSMTLVKEVEGALPCSPCAKL